MWMSLVLTLCVVSVVAWFLAAGAPSRAQRARDRFASFAFLAAFTAATLIGVPRPRMPAVGPLRVFFAAWFCFALVMSTAYIASLRSLLDDPWVRGEIRTLADILDSGLDVLTHPNLHSGLVELGKNNSTLAELARRVQYEVSAVGPGQGMSA